VHAILPGVVCAWLLLAPPIRLFQAQPAEA
jgi:hypothetical protein